MLPVPIERKIYVLRAYLGLDSGERRTLKSIGDELGVTRERARQMASEARTQIGPETLREWERNVGLFPDTVGRRDGAAKRLKRFLEGREEVTYAALIAIGCRLPRESDGADKAELFRLIRLSGIHLAKARGLSWCNIGKHFVPSENASGRGRCRVCNTKIHQRWAEKNPEYVKCKAREARLKNPEVGRRSSSERIKRQRDQADGTLTTEIVNQIKAEATHCAYCGCELGERQTDHIVPIVLGGAHSIRNVVVVCLPCNRHKLAMPPAEWLERIEPEHRARVLRLYVERGIELGAVAAT